MKANFTQRQTRLFACRESINTDSKINANQQQSSIKKDKIVKGASILAIGGLITKFLGALYRIPLTSLLGVEGLSIYQTVFPIYCILLTFSSTGVPTAIAKLISSGFGEKIVLKRALSFFVPLGFLGSLLMIFFSLPIARLQGNVLATPAYITLAPSVVAVSFISCLRGYFQGRMNMLPTALSQIIEQVIKLTVGLALCFFIKASPIILGSLACLAVTISEIIALLYLFIAYKKASPPQISTFILPFKRLIGTLLPIIISTLLLPISRAFDSFTIVNVLKTYTPHAKALYGIYTGSVESVSGVPVAICYGIAVAVLPSISRSIANKDILNVKDNLKKSFSLTLFSSTFLGLILFTFAPIITKILFSKLSPYHSFVTAKLISISFFSVIGLSLLQTLNSCLIALGKPFAPCLFLSFGLIAKFILQLYLLKIPSINIFGGVYSDIVCYFVAVFLDLLYIITVLKFKREKSK
ncbi:MAG: polysaccharide biosynthesis protein [Clostridia bacterium]|nr:polysaccharide biosynthesis protein [Clostridia bacterium]